MQKDEIIALRNRIVDLIKSHPEFGKILAGLEHAEVISVWGINEGMEDLFLKALEREQSTSFIYSIDPAIKTEELSFLYIDKSKEKRTLHALGTKLEELGYDRVDRIGNFGEYSVRGGIVDIYANEYIVRIDFFGDDIENIYLIDPLTGSIEYNAEYGFIPSTKAPLLVSSYDLPLNTKNIILFNHTAIDTIYYFDFEPLPFVFANDKLFEFELKKRAGKTVIIASKNADYIEKVKEFNIPLNIEYFDETFPTGFSSKELQVSLFTDKELSGKLNLNLQRKKKNQNLLLISEINLEDLVVHEDHGIAIYKGVVTKEVQGIIKEYLFLQYAKEDKLFVPLDQLVKVTKFIGAHGERPKLTRLGTVEWERAKEKVKKSIQDMAAELLQLYAMRELAKKQPIGPDSIQYEELENSFEYDLTPDQSTSIDEMMKDLESKRPMDRLIVGDVGYGKTEVAIRAAFKVVENNMQVAVLAPTTILAEQLLEVFKERLSRFPITVAGMSRFQGDEKNKEVIKALKKGDVHVVVGTHRLLQNDVEFNNLGLLVIDEEQRFGVKQKEKLKGLRIDTNILSMSATPIPRTMHMALSGAKDISVINTAPRGRVSIKTQLLQRDWPKIQEIIEDEVSAGRQVYFVHNRVATIMHTKQKLEEMMPNVRFVEGHGQMVSSHLEKVVEGFRAHQYDVLIASTIIENGIDIPNVNTIIINNAQRFGLSQLYQLRGRVGRSDLQSFCYLVYPPEFELEGPARQRLYAIMNAQDLGSGFSIAMKDLEIRGAGNFLGKEQHGNITAVGFELFTKLLSSEVARLKEAM
jgi:transcription-repair coupling factor (superfamily II helicase)